MDEDTTEKRIIGAIGWLKSLYDDMELDLPTIIHNSTGRGLHNPLRIIFAYIEVLGETYKIVASSKFDTEPLSSTALLTSEICSKAIDSEIKNSDASIAFIKEYLGRVNPIYREMGGLIYTIFRHGVIHTAKPKYYEYKSIELKWIIWRNNHASCEVKDCKYTDVNGHVYSHLKIEKISSKEIVVPISIDRFYLDLQKAFRYYLEDLRNDSIIASNVGYMVEKTITPIKIGIDEKGVFETITFPHEKKKYRPQIKTSEIELLEKIISAN